MMGNKLLAAGHAKVYTLEGTEMRPLVFMASEAGYCNLEAAHGMSTYYTPFLKPGRNVQYNTCPLLNNTTLDTHLAYIPVFVGHI